MKQYFDINNEIIIVRITKNNKKYMCLFAENVMFFTLKDIKLILETIKKLDILRITTKMKF